MKSRKTYLILTLLGLIGVAGLQHFYLNRWAKGTLYLVTIGFFGVGTVIDLFKANETVDQYITGRGFVNSNSRNAVGV